MRWNSLLASASRRSFASRKPERLAGVADRKDSAENAFSLFKQMISTSETPQQKLENSLSVLQGIRLSKDNSSVLLIAGLSSCFRKLVLWHKLQSQSYGGFGADEQTLKSNGFGNNIIQNQYRKASKIWTIGQATAILGILAATDMQIRSDGTATEDILLQKMLFEIIVKKGASLATAEY